MTAICGVGGTYGQGWSVGVKAGVPITEAVEGSYGVNSAAKRYTVGAMLEIGLPLSFAFEVNALYRRTGYDTSTSNLGTTTEERVRANAWEFPLLLKYYISTRFLPVRLYTSGGYVVRNLSGLDVVSHSFGVNLGTGLPFDNTFRPQYAQYYVRDNPTHGVAVGAGARFHAGPLRVSPELRYTRWTGRSFNESGSQGFFVQSGQNQVDLLLGLTF